MDIGAFEQELRMVKRRRIEIRGMKAALDMEEFHLDERQFALEQILVRGGKGLGSARGGSVRARGDGSGENVRHDVMRDDNTNAKGGEVKIKQEQGEDAGSKQGPQVAEVVTIDDNENGDNGENDDTVVLFSRKRKAGKSVMDNTVKTNSPIRKFFQSVSSPQIESQPGTIPSKPTKIVVLKIRFDPSKPRHINNASIPSVKRPPPIKSSPPPTQSNQCRPPLPSTRPLAPPFTSPNTIRPPPLLPPHYYTKINRNAPPKEPQCMCGGRNHNCRTCRGTPAVIAEGRSVLGLSTPSSTSTSTSPAMSSRPIGQRPIPRPQSYRVPEFQEMTGSERKELEVRFCRRVVVSLAQMIARGDGSDWISILKRRGEPLLEELKLLVKKKPVARENSSGTWDGRVMVSKCKDLNEFAGAVGEVVQRLTVDHPRGCCAGEQPSKEGDKVVKQTVNDGDVDMWIRDDKGKYVEMDIDLDVAEQKCWKDGFGCWFEVQMQRGRKCIDACVLALDGEERNEVVDGWEIG